MSPHFISWSDNWLTGSSQIDAQHREMVDRAAALQKAIASGWPLPDLERLLNALVDFARCHFTDEEGLMLASGYPGYEEHRLEHQRLLDQLKQVRRSLPSGAPAAADLVGVVLAAWTVPHMLLSDRQLVLHLSKRKAT